MTPEIKIPLFKVFMAETAAPEVTKVLNSGFIGQGPKVNEFEKNLEDFFGKNYVLTLNSGTSGLHLALHLLKQPAQYEHTFDGMAGVVNKWPGLEDGDEVLCTSLTCTASNFPVLANNLKIKWVDIDPETLNMDLDDLARKITPKTKVIMLVHWGGYPNDLDKVKQIQMNAFRINGFSPVVIEDGAHSFGTKYNGKLLGHHGNIVMYSLQAIKHINSLDGGLLVFPHKELYDRAKLLRWYGIDREENRPDMRCEKDIFQAGFKFHMNDVCATVGIENLKHAKDIISKHQANAAFYDKELADVPGVTLLTRHKGHDSAFWIYSLLVERRHEFMQHMANHGIATSQVHERNDKHTCVREFKTQLPTLDKTIGKVVAIPVGWWILPEHRQHIVNVIKKGW